MWKLLIFLFFIKSISALKKCNASNMINITNGNMSTNGDIVYKWNTYRRSNYFENKGTITACECQAEVCILKCCPPGKGYNWYLKKCVPIREPFSINSREFIKAPSKNVTDYFQINYHKPWCKKNEVRTTLDQIPSLLNEIRDNGQLYVKLQSSYPPWMLRGPDSYCVDTFLFQDEEGNVTSSFDALVCFLTEKKDKHYVMTSTCMLISCVFILATVAVYGWLPELRNLHGRVLMAYLLCLFVGFIGMATMQILLHINNIIVKTCVGLTIMIYFSLLAAFFWLNVMCFDIWWTFSGKRGVGGDTMPLQAKFNAYSIYAFGFPAVLTILMVSLEFSGLPPHPLLPMLRLQGCFLDGTSRLLYLYGPIVILWFANVVFFVMTAVKIAQIKKQVSVLKHKENARHDKHQKDKQRLLLYIKLFVVMGINWLLEVISALYPDPGYMWQIIDSYNVLIGPIVFVIFVCKRKIFILIRKRIKEGIFGEKEDAECMTMNHNQKILRNIKDYKHRDSIDTIQSGCPDTDSNKTV